MFFHSHPDRTFDPTSRRHFWAYENANVSISSKFYEQFIGPHWQIFDFYELFYDFKNYIENEFWNRIIYTDIYLVQFHEKLQNENLANFAGKTFYHNEYTWSSRYRNVD